MTDINDDLDKIIEDEFGFKPTLARPNPPSLLTVKKEMKMAPTVDNNYNLAGQGVPAPDKSSELDQVIASINSAIDTAQKALYRLGSKNADIFGPSPPSDKASDGSNGSVSTKLPKISLLNQTVARLHSVMESLHQELNKLERL